MADKLVILSSYSTPVEADLVISLLQAEGIQARLSDEAAAGWMWHLSGAIGGAKVLVHEKDEDRARELLREFEEERSADQSSGNLPTGPWQCPKCSEQLSEDFELCWKCGTPYEPGSETVPPEPTPTAKQAAVLEPALAANESPGEIWSCPSCSQSVSVEELTCPLCGTSAEGRLNPYFTRAGALQTPSVRPRKRVTDDGEELAVRAWRAAIIGTVILPPLLNRYSIYLLLTIAVRHQGLTPAGNRRFYSALVVNIVVGAIVGTFGRWLFLATPGAY